MSTLRADWLGLLPPSPVTRFAPSPTGELHLGHVAHALWTWGIARAAGGTVLLRIEDHDRGRSRTEYEDRILQDLAWLGLVPDALSLASLSGSDPSPWRQSDCGAVYEEALASLPGVYACQCSRSRIARDADMGQLSGGQELRYPGTCREAGIPPATLATGLRVPLADDLIHFIDPRLGPQEQQPSAQCGDLLLRDAKGNWTYQFAVTVDDLRHGVTLVVRGEDLLASTGRQILLGSMLGRPAPAIFLHHPLIYGEDGRKLSKRHHSLTLRAMREGGATPTMVKAEAAKRSGLPRELEGEARSEK